MGRPALEVADIFREHGPAWREAKRGHLSLAQLKVMSAIEQCRSAALGGHVLRCEGCGADQVSYNSCRNRHCPKCQSGVAQRWLGTRQADLLPVEYSHVAFTLPAPIADVACQNKPRSTACCSTWPPRCCRPSLPTASTWARASAPRWSLHT
jgi:hypothetical protein